MGVGELWCLRCGWALGGELIAVSLCDFTIALFHHSTSYQLDSHEQESQVLTYALKITPTAISLRTTTTSLAAPPRVPHVALRTGNAWIMVYAITPRTITMGDMDVRIRRGGVRYALVISAQMVCGISFFILKLE